METPPRPDAQGPSSGKNPLQKLTALIEKLISLPVVLLSKLIPKGKKNSVQVHAPEGEPRKNPLAGVVKFIPAPVKNLAASLFAKLEGLLDKGIAKLPEPMRGMFAAHRRKIAIVIVILLAVFIGKKFLPESGKPKISLEQAMQQNQQSSEDAPIPVKGFKVGRFNFEDSLNALGTIKGAMEFKLSFEVPGTVSSINYREGERYEEGALLISLKQDDVLLRLKRAQAEFNKAKTQADIAGQKVKENETLYAMGAVPKTTLDQIKLEHESAKYEAEANRLEVKANEAMLEKSNLYAPSAGMIGELSIEEGETISQNTLLGTHIMTEYVYAEFGVVERDVNKIALGQKARVFVDAYPDKTFEGVIENIAPVVAGTSRTATAKVRIENPDRLLLPGMFSRIRILLYSKKNTLVIPTDSVQGKEGEQFVYVVHSDGKPLIKKDSKKEGEAAEGGAAEGAPAQGGQQGAAEPTQKSQEQVVNPEGEKETPKKDKKKKGKKGEPEASPEPEKKVEELTVKKRPITVGYTRPDYTQIDAGLSEGEVVAISGLERLEDDKKVRLLETQEAEI